MFGIGMPELIVILFVALLVIGPKKLPEIAKSLGRAINEFKRATQDITDTIDIKENIRPAVKPIEDLISYDKSEESENADRSEAAAERPENEGPGDGSGPNGDAETLTAEKNDNAQKEVSEKIKKTKGHAPENGGMDG